MINQKMIKADLQVAQQLLYGKSSVNNEYLINLAVYHSVQAIEKNLKYIYEKNSGKQSIYTHNTSELLTQAREYLSEKTFFALNKLARNLTACNQLRYEDAYIDKKIAIRYFKLAKDFCGKTFNKEKQIKERE